MNHYSYDRTAAIQPLLIDTDRVTRWIAGTVKKRVEAIFLHPGSTDLTIVAMVNLEGGTHATYEVRLQPRWTPEGLSIVPSIRGVR